ncbi:hypothetical protein [Lactococcus petauri]|uniref:hypothetical protein n=1 Tax=Lactococcus petauri TaxID=1940789 RepID=UPI003853CF52
MSYRLENGELYPRATHPGSGEAAYWPEGETYTNTGQWPGAMITRETAQNLIQDKGTNNPTGVAHTLPGHS